MVFTPAALPDLIGECAYFDRYSFDNALSNREIAV
jgi:hypothetical protein